MTSRPGSPEAREPKMVDRASARGSLGDVASGGSGIVPDPWAEGTGRGDMVHVTLPGGVPG